MKWVKSRPVEPGHYWRRLCNHDGPCEPEMVEVALIVAGDPYRGHKGSGVHGTLLEDAIVLLNEQPSEIDYDAWWEWAGPVPHPSDNRAGAK